MFENDYSYKDVAELFLTFYEVNIAKINLLFIQVLQKRYNRDPTLVIEKDTDIYKSRRDQIETIEKRRTLKKVMKRTERNKEEEDEDEDDEDSDIHSCKQYKAKKDFESVLHNEVQKAIKRKSERDEPSEASEEEDEDEDTEEIIRKHQLKKPKKFIKNTNNNNKTKNSKPNIILITPHKQPPPPPGAASSLTLQQPRSCPQICKTS
jgi:hypothetical protein